MKIKFDSLSWSRLHAPTQRHFERCPYGVPAYWGCHWHQRDNGYVVSYDGQVIWEVGQGKATVLVMPKDPFGYGWKTRINKTLMGTGLYVHIFRKKRANGITEWTLVFYDHVNHKRYKEVTCRERVQFTDEQGNLVLEPAEALVEISKDNAQYRAFNKELKRLKGVLVAQIKLGGYQWALDRNSFETSEQVAEYKSLFPHAQLEENKRYVGYGFYAMRNNLNVDDFYSAVVSWTNFSDRSPENVKRIMWWILLNHYPAYRYRTQNTDFAAAQQRCVINGLRTVQVRFLRENCVTISESKNTLGSSNDARQNEDSQLFPPDRLREVQVPCEAEVC